MAKKRPEDLQTKLSSMTAEEKLQYLKRYFPEHRVTLQNCEGIFVRMFGKQTRDWNSGSTCLGRDGD